MSDDTVVTITDVTDNTENVVLVEQRDRILIITINRPDAKMPSMPPSAAAWLTRWIGSTATQASRSVC